MKTSIISRYSTIKINKKGFPYIEFTMKGLILG
jgi:hypothetical protein